MWATTLTILVRMHSLHKEPARITRASMIAIARFYIVYLQMPVLELKFVVVVVVVVVVVAPAAVLVTSITLSPYL
jgi:hypothetical protein